MGVLKKTYFDQVDKRKENQNSSLSNTEEILIDLMKDFELDLSD